MKNHSRVPQSPLYQYLYKLCPTNLNNWQILFYEISRQLIFLISPSSPQSLKNTRRSVNSIKLPHQPLAKSWHHFCTCWTDITSTAYKATVCLWMFMDSKFCAHTSSLVHLFNSVTIFQMRLCWCCISCTGEVYVASWWDYVPTSYSNSWLWSFVWQQWNGKPYILTCQFSCSLTALYLYVCFWLIRGTLNK